MERRYDKGGLNTMKKVKVKSPSGKEAIGEVNEQWTKRLNKLLSKED